MRAQHERVVLAGRRGGTLYGAVRKGASRFLSDGIALNDLRAQMVRAAGGLLRAPGRCRGELRAPALRPGGSPHPVAPCRFGLHACLLRPEGRKALAARRIIKRRSRKAMGKGKELFRPQHQAQSRF